MKKKAVFRIAFPILLISIYVLVFPFTRFVHADQNGNAIVLTNSASEFFGDYEHYIEPYLLNFGIPHTVTDIAGNPLPENLEEYAIIIIGHKGIDESGFLLDSADQLAIADAVAAGTGLLNFDSILTYQDGLPRYEYIQEIFNFSYQSEITADSVEIVQGAGTYRIDCWDDETQYPVLLTVNTVNGGDGAWDEYKGSTTPFSTVVAGHDEWENNGLSPMHFYHEQIPNGRYEIFVNLYTSSHTRHYIGFTENEVLSQTRWVDNVFSDGDSTGHAEYSLGIIEINNERFDFWIGDGDLLSGNPGYYGLAWIRIVPEEIAGDELHYIGALHPIGDKIYFKADINTQ
ncbi:MAG: hypothetical protein SCH71_10535, partial [Desulfobulbaceae bacterium]|nr:hypothetical protein [Desulfobulbaceae bacterium]